MTFKVKNKKLKRESSFKVEKQNPIDIYEKYWTFKLDNNKAKVSLGNFSDAGWYWSGNENDLIGFSYRLEHSQVKEQFYNTMNEKKVSFDKLKPLFLKSAESKDGLYEITGDNQRWHFGEVDSSDTEFFLQEEKLTEKQEDKFYEKYSPITYETFEKKYGKEYKQDVKKLINSSHSFEDFNEKLNDLSFEYNEKVRNENFRRMSKVINKIKNKK